MHSEASNKLLGHLYEIVPAKESKAAITAEIFPEDNGVQLDELLKELIGEGYIYQWKNAPEQKSDEYGITPQGIIFYDHYSYDGKKPAMVRLNQEQPRPENAVALEGPAMAPQEKKQKISFWRIMPIIILIAFAVALVWFITHTKNHAL